MHEGLSVVLRGCEAGAPVTILGVGTLLSLRRADLALPALGTAVDEQPLGLTDQLLVMIDDAAGKLLPPSLASLDPLARLGKATEVPIKVVQVVILAGAPQPWLVSVGLLGHFLLLFMAKALVELRRLMTLGN